jgi:hypothetical protein
MQNIASSFVSEYEFIKNVNNDIVSAIYPMREHINKNNNLMFLGGSIETGNSRFDELGIPAGLYLESIGHSLHNSEPIRTRQITCTVIDDHMFDNLLGKVSSVKPYTGPRRNYGNKNNKNIKKTKKSAK